MVSRLSFLFLLLFASVSFAQKGNNNLDSLLLECDFTKLKDAVTNLDTSVSASYMKIIASVMDIPKMINKEMLIEQAKSYKSYYKENYAGFSASKAFAKFESSADKGNQNEAVTFFFIARFF